jgi:hypothetical protein
VRVAEGAVGGRRQGGHVDLGSVWCVGVLALWAEVFGCHGLAVLELDGVDVGREAADVDSALVGADRAAEAEGGEGGAARTGFGVVVGWRRAGGGRAVEGGVGGAGAVAAVAEGGEGGGEGRSRVLRPYRGTIWCCT